MESLIRRQTRLAHSRVDATAAPDGYVNNIRTRVTRIDVRVIAAVAPGIMAPRTRPRREPPNPFMHMSRAQLMHAITQLTAVITRMHGSDPHFDALVEARHLMQRAKTARDHALLCKWDSRPHALWRLLTHDHQPAP